MQTVSWQIQNKASMKHCSWFFPFPIYPMQKCNIFIYYLSYKRAGTKWFTGLKIIKQSTFCTMGLYKTPNLKFIWIHCRNQNGLHWMSKITASFNPHQTTILNVFQLGLNFFAYKFIRVDMRYSFIHFLNYMYSSAVSDIKKWHHICYPITSEWEKNIQFSSGCSFGKQSAAIYKQIFLVISSLFYEIKLF